LGLTEWSVLLMRAGFTGIRAERMDQDIAFQPWTQRMRCDASAVAKLKSMLDEPRLNAFLRPRLNQDGLMFTLQEAIIVAAKPGRA
jgi:hypothetical protein